jgi:pimeloyl-ACP methyl ester carboxylesterase
METTHFIRSNGNRVDYIDTGSGDNLLVYHHGTPGAGPMEPEILEAAQANNFRVVELIRPGYINSTREVGRTVADVVPLTLELVDHLGFENFVTMGWSGGGPHALATAALAGDRCKAAMSLAGVGPWGDDELDFLEGMGQDNLDEFGAALVGETALRPFLEEFLPALRSANGASVIEALSSVLPQADLEYLTDEAAQEFAEQTKAALSTGVDGWLDDDIAFVLPWGFEISDISIPVSLWQGDTDLMVPFSHGQYLGRKLPHASLHLLAGHGHLSIGQIACKEGFAELAKHLN